MYEDEQDQRHEIADMEEFLQYARLFSFCNYELSLNQDISQQQKEEMIGDYVADSMEMFGPEDLDGIITIDQVRQIFGDRIKTDPIQNEQYIDAEELMEAVVETTVQITINLANQLVDQGKMVMYPDENGEIVYQNKEKFEEEHKSN